MKIAHRPILRNYIFHMVTICRVGRSAVDVMIWTFAYFCCEKLCVADVKACNLITRSQLTNYCVLSTPTVVSEQSGMSGILKSSSHYIDGWATYLGRQSRTPTGIAVTHILLLLLFHISKRLPLIQSPQPLFRLGGSNIYQHTDTN